MSIIVGADGNPIPKDEDIKDYSAGGLRFRSPVTPDMILHAAASRAPGGDPFAIEPCAMAVFMYLCREIGYRDTVIAQISDRLERLGSEPLNLTHPYPLPDDSDG